MTSKLLQAQLLVVAIALAATLIWAFATWQAEAFTACLVEHSYETCRSALR